MNAEQRNKLFSDLTVTELSLMHLKGHAYSGDHDVLSNFKRNAERLGLTPFQVLQVYMNKHFDSINQAIADNPDYPVDRSEDFTSRINDARNYLGLLHCLMVDLAPTARMTATEIDSADRQRQFTPDDSLDKLNKHLSQSHDDTPNQPSI